MKTIILVMASLVFGILTTKAQTKDNTQTSSTKVSINVDGVRFRELELVLDGVNGTKL